MTSKQRAYLKGLAMNIDPILNIGKSSLTPEFTQSVNEVQVIGRKIVFYRPSKEHKKIELPK